MISVIPAAEKSGKNSYCTGAGDFTIYQCFFAAVQQLSGYWTIDMSNLIRFDFLSSL
ncbi:MAG: hypothetical protein O4861_19615 [Trichodesmium sp. St16_bin4-tuft]|uniref:hypothetical protein n=1 Tax=Trichodesmium erythraeum TaxID=1206 RepID=UPI0012DE0F83|nr:hypothetical protein [Trichodesmium erythraeum GBRTRLIN201]MCH2048283.1 hypothetical protein [Trichodesmium sp. ALOHA_ZT_67]MCL2928896.1 hypothetical protein [Trichodesmium sp. MAG_R01]MDE5070399.1 hypothetical protein [Trichodesmium sp. St5_bin8]MDE5096135.1 hypothetical protein [Trichodesmium sp. St11_bin5]MDE5100414.1 hypothetical protein [Trichodesmium sp. St16_bin4-tuft]MDE5103764.1 hypothetical protein [Trichodesmium sp. St19_bin2]MDT9339203.1 hypothetical protein [Trichodesmium ery